jgi:hypothetical protein
MSQQIMIFAGICGTNDCAKDNFKQSSAFDCDLFGKQKRKGKQHPDVDCQRQKKGKISRLK